MSIATVVLFVLAVTVVMVGLIAFSVAGQPDKRVTIAVKNNKFGETTRNKVSQAYNDTYGHGELKRVDRNWE